MAELSLTAQEEANRRPEKRLAVRRLIVFRSTRERESTTDGQFPARPSGWQTAERQTHTHLILGRGSARSRVWSAGPPVQWRGPCHLTAHTRSADTQASPLQSLQLQRPSRMSPSHRQRPLAAVRTDRGAMLDVISTARPVVPVSRPTRTREARIRAAERRHGEDDSAEQ